MQTEELSGQAQNSTPSAVSEEEKLAPSSDEALKEIKEATGAKNKEVGWRSQVVAAAAAAERITSLCLKLIRLWFYAKMASEDLFLHRRVILWRR